MNPIYAIRTVPPMTRRRIIIIAEDYRQLDTLLASKIVRCVNGSDLLDELQAELQRAHIVGKEEMPGDVVTMNSTVSLRDLGTNQIETYTLVYPNGADIANHKLSVLAPNGTAILGYRVGDMLHWRVPEGLRGLKVERVTQPPERNGALRS